MGRCNRTPFTVYYEDDESDRHHHAKYAIADVGEMPPTVQITCKVGFKEGEGGVVMFGGNDTDSYLAGYYIIKTGSQLWFCVQMNANGSDGPIMSDDDDRFNSEEGVHIVATYDGTWARLYADGELLAEGERNWVPADGGIITQLAGSHLEGEPKEVGGEDGGGVAWIKDLYISNCASRYQLFDKVLCKYKHEVEEPAWAVGDAGGMYDSIMMQCQVWIDPDCAGGTLMMYGGNCEDSYQAGYILYWDTNNGFIWGIQMNANGSEAAMVTNEQGTTEDENPSFPAGEYRVTGFYKNGKARLVVETEDDNVYEFTKDTTWCMAEGGVASALTGDHREGEQKDTAPAGQMEISRIFIATI
jgi:hypothetical protein